MVNANGLAMAPPVKISVIIPARNAAHFLARTLPALRSSTFADYELIVVDDASSDDTAVVAESAGARVLRISENRGPSGARNAGVEIANGQLLVFMDADVEPRPETLQLLWESLDENPDVAAVFGSYDDDPADRHLVSVFKNLMHHYVHQQGSPDASTFWTGCGAIRREVYDAVGPLHPVSLTCVEDIDYGHRLKDAGYKIWLRRDIQVKHLKRWTFWRLVRTDVMQRGIPWTVMMLRRGKLDSDLNLDWRHRAAALLAVVFCLLLILTLPGLVFAASPGRFAGLTLSATAAAGILSLLCLCGLLWIQRDFYSFLAQRRGALFALKCVPLHVLYYVYSAIAACGGVVLSVLDTSN